MGGRIYYKVYAKDVYGNYAGTPQLSLTLGEVGAAGPPGDINGDGSVDYIDLAILASSYGKSSEEPGFNPLCDLNGDGVVNYVDLAILASNYG